RTLPTLVRLRAVQGEVTARPGGAVSCPFVLDRTPNFTGAMTLVLLETPGFTAEAGGIEAGSRAAVLHGRLHKGGRPPPAPGLRFRATGQLASGAAVVTEATVAVGLEEK